MSEKKSNGQLLQEMNDKLDVILKRLKGTREPDYYHAMEELLRAVPKFRRLAEHPEDYGFFPVEKSKDISVAPPPGIGITDKVMTAEMYVESRKASFARTMERYADIDAVVRAFEGRREFIVIRLFYLCEELDGSDRGVDARAYTWEEIQELMEAAGITRSLSVIRGWRSKLVREMAVMMWPEAALTIDSYRRRYQEAAT